ncbi:MAG: hypothetical protein A2075_11510 [Geobacteraceae bacterium GWC2_58_44]|nr:MAG: hypothetical protein A2075_11510 [Geobacteraceae bacterium GWC2_58_44]
MKKILLYLVLPGVLLALWFYFNAPGLLAYSEEPRRADAVVLFLGPEHVDRFDEAMRLIRGGYARFLIIPAFGLTLDKGAAEKLEKDHKGLKLQGNEFRIRKVVNYGKHYENTHVEALEAKRQLDERGLRSALVVSSSYHMRRISLINSRVFSANEYALSYVPCRPQRNFTSADWSNRDTGKTMIREYLKMGWFLIYGIFS